jgi:hypothetical protein
MKDKKGDDTWWFVIPVAILVLGIWAGFFILIVVAVGGFFWLVYRLYRDYQNSPEKQEARARQRAQELYDAVKARSSPELDKTSFGKGVMDHVRLNVPDPVLDAVTLTALAIYDMEDWRVDVPPPPPVCNSIDGARYLDRLSRVGAMDMSQVKLIQKTLGETFRPCLGTLDDVVEGDKFVAAPLHTYVDDHSRAVTTIVSQVFSSPVAHHFPKLRAAFDRNLNAQKGVLPRDYKGTDVLEAYLGGTPFHDLLHARVAVPVPRPIRWEHVVVTAGTGHGKTTLLENLILRDLKDDAQPAIVIVDSQRQLIAKLSRLAVAHGRKLIIIDPKDSPALNIFAVNGARFRQYGAIEQERVRNHTLELFGYLFDSLLGADLTVRQGALFNYLTMVMLAMPQTMGRNATLFDIIKFTERPQDYAPAIASLEEIAQEFFRTDFVRPQYNATKEQIRYRLHAIIGNATLSRLFIAQENAIDFFTELNSGAIILIDTDKGFLGEKNSSYLGRIAITLILQAILERDASEKPEREVFMYVDEAGEYFDRSINKFLTEARKQRAGITFAHQDFGQVPADLRASIAANTATKYAGGGSAADARALAPDMRTTADFILGQERLSFACYVRNVTKAAVSISVGVGVLDREDQVSEDAYRAFRVQNKERLAGTVSRPPPPEPPSEHKPAEENIKEW